MIQREVEAAERRIREYVPESPIVLSEQLSDALGVAVYLKLENLQPTGSFKIRGAFHKLLSLDDEARRRGIIAASTGNHGIAVSHAAERLGIPGTIVLPENVSPGKADVVRDSSMEVTLFGADCVAAEAFARRESIDRGYTYISPYNDPGVVAGQGTIAMELAAQLPSVETVLVPVGGGGLISGIAGYFHESGSSVRIVGCLPEASPEMYESIRTGQRVEPLGLPTLSDGTVGGFEAGSITFELCRRYVDDWILVREDEIQEALAGLEREHGHPVEGSGALTAAAARKLADPGRTTALIVSGGR